MGAKAVHDLWGQALLFEARYSDRAPQVAADKADRLRKAGDRIEADFWSRVADCLRELHRIRHGHMDPQDPVRDAAASPAVRMPGSFPSS